MLACMTGPPDTKTIPSDLATCQLLIQEQAYLVESQTHTIGDLHGQIKTLKQQQEEFKLQIKLLIERAFGRRSERYLSDPNQLLIDFGDDAADAADGLAEAIDEASLEEQVIPEQVIPAHVRRKKKKRRDEGLPEHLPRYEVEAPVSDEQKQCPEHGERKVIGYDRVETLVFERPKLWVPITKYPSPNTQNTLVRTSRSVALARRSGRPGWSKAIATTLPSRRKSSPTNTAITCRSIASKINSPAAAGLRVDRRCSTF